VVRRRLRKMMVFLMIDLFKNKRLNYLKVVEKSDIAELEQKKEGKVMVFFLSNVLYFFVFLDR